MSKGNGKSVARVVSGARGERAAQVPGGTKTPHAHGHAHGHAHDNGNGGFVFDMRALGRRPGEYRDERRTAHAPDGLGSGLVLVPAGADVALDLRFTAVS